MRDDLHPLDRDGSAARAAEVATARARNQLPLEAEVDEFKASWVLVLAEPGFDDDALRWLARRGFGVFQPMQLRAAGRYDGALPNGRHAPVRMLEPTFPGYLFVRVWDVSKMWDRLLKCPRVEEIIDVQRRAPWVTHHPDTPACPPGLSIDEFVDMLRGFHEAACATLARLTNAPVNQGHWQVTAKRQRHRRRRKTNRITTRTDRRAAELLAKQLAQLEPAGRISLLLETVSRALPVAGDQPPGNGG